MEEAAGTRPDAESFLKLRERIVADYPDLSPQLKSIAQFALSNPDRMAVETAGQLAARLGVPASGIVRFAQAMGYSGFLEMKRAFSENLMYRAQALEVEHPAGDRPAGHLVEAIAQARHGLAALEREIDADTFENAVDALDGPGHIFVSAQHASYPLASMLAWRMIEGGRQCILLDNVGGMALRQSQLAGPDDATLAISFSPYQPSVVEAAKAHRGNGGKVVAITDTLLSPLAPHASVALVVPGNGGEANGLVGPATLLAALAEAVAERSWERKTRQDKPELPEVPRGNRSQDA